MEFKAVPIYIRYNEPIIIDYTAYNMLLVILHRGSSYCMVVFDDWSNIAVIAKSNTTDITYSAANKIATLNTTMASVRGMALMSKYPGT